MLKRYVIVVSCAVLLTNLLIFAYYFYLDSAFEPRSARIETVYSQIDYSGPIQPIPEIESIDQRWVLLGKALFDSKLLSSDNTIACASCHLINYGGDDGVPVSVGIKGRLGDRNSPSVINSVFNVRQFWDGREIDLADQAARPIHNPVEMGSNWQQVISKLEADETFRKAFRDLDDNGITIENITLAITTFEESLVTPNSPFDQYLLGDLDAITEKQKRGWQKFNSFGCIACHQGRNIGGNFFQRIGGIEQIPAILADDLGRYNVTKDERDKHVFKVPSLRNIAETAPYFHNGSVPTLSEAVAIMAKMQLGLVLSTEDVDELTALLESFSGELWQNPEAAQ